MQMYERLADALLGRKVRPFAGAYTPEFGAEGRVRTDQYTSNFATYHWDLAGLLAQHAGPGG